MGRVEVADAFFLGFRDGRLKPRVALGFRRVQGAGFRVYEGLGLRSLDFWV